MTPSLFEGVPPFGVRRFVARLRGNAWNLFRLGNRFHTTKQVALTFDKLQSGLWNPQPGNVPEIPYLTVTYSCYTLPPATRCGCGGNDGVPRPLWGTGILLHVYGCGTG